MWTTVPLLNWHKPLKIKSFPDHVREPLGLCELFQSRLSWWQNQSQVLKMYKRPCLAEQTPGLELSRFVLQALVFANGVCKLSQRKPLLPCGVQLLPRKAVWDELHQPPSGRCWDMFFVSRLLLDESYLQYCINPWKAVHKPIACSLCRGPFHPMSL